jgi:minor histocompatibility antigen H13
VQAAQPALLYIVPGVLGAALTHAAIRGEVREVFFWQEKEEPVADDGKEEAKAVEEEKASGAAAAEGSQVRFLQLKWMHRITSTFG